MADQVEDQGQQVVQSFASDLEGWIKENNHTQDVNDRTTNRFIKTIFSVCVAVLSVGGFGIASYRVIWHKDSKVREAMASNVWTPLSAIAGLLAGMALK
jgi:hypothetical protein